MAGDAGDHVAQVCLGLDTVQDRRGLAVYTLLRRIDCSNSRHRFRFASRHANVLTLRQSRHSPHR
jgi:hypothetical protein